MQKPSLREWILGALFIAIGILLPILFHQIPGGGPMILPMHIPVFMAGLFLSPVVALLVGALTPLLSSLMTGMPPMFPMMVIMIFELAVYGFLTALLLKKTKNIWISLLSAMVAGRIMAGLVVFVLASFFGLKMKPLLFIQGAILKGLPGIVIQLILIPLCYFLLVKRVKPLK